MVEAFAVLSVAANIARFVDFAQQLIRGGKEIYNSTEGTREEHQALKVLIEDIRNLNDEVKLNPPNSQISSDERGFRRLAAECQPLADQLWDVLADLEVPTDTRFRGIQSVKQTLRSAAKKKDIQQLQKRLSDIDVRLRDRASRMLQRESSSNIASAINTLNRTNQRLNINTEVTLDKLREDILQSLSQHGDALKGFSKLESLSVQLLTLADEGKKMRREQRVLESLVFEEMEQREEAIKEAHKTTLDWMFGRNEAKFMEWLEGEQGIYWVRGKAGSGKSTLMKYICNHRETMYALRRWAGPTTLFTANFFFWNSGYPMQKSQVGLLQSLLYQIFRACPSMILEVCPERGEKLPWKRKELFEALDKVSKRTVLPAKFCFFVDGLYEYEGDDEDIITLLQDLASSPSVKICVSSRPWNAFLDAFNDSPWNLVLEVLTKEDMRKYVQTMLAQNPVFAEVTSHDPRCQTLVPQIAEKAQGVWLWVYLVVRDLLRDLKGGEEYVILQRRLDSFPEELEKYFENILGRIDKLHRVETARIFLMAVAAIRPMPLLSLHYLRLEVDDREYPLKQQIQLTGPQLFQIKMKWEKLLNTRCRDLLEVLDSIKEDSHILENRVGFLHRTVADFLRDNYEEELLGRAGEHFSAKHSLLSSLIALAGLNCSSDAACTDMGQPSIIYRFDRTDALDLADEVLWYARDLEREGRLPSTVLLDKFDQIYSTRSKNSSKSGKIHWTNLRGPPEAAGGSFGEDGHCTFLALTIQAGLRKYVEAKLSANPALMIEKLGRPLIDYALRPERKSKGLPNLEKDHTIDCGMLRLLLERGSDPYERIEIYGRRTTFSQFLFHCYHNAGTILPDPPDGVRKSIYQAIEIMIEHGADSYAAHSSPQSAKMPRRSTKLIESTREMGVAENGYSFSTIMAVQNMLCSIFGEEDAAPLLSLMDEIAEQQRRQSSILWKLLGW